MKNIKPSKEPIRNPEKINLNKLKFYLITQGYDEIRMKQPWCNVIGSLNKAGRKYFFKMGSNQVISDAIRNECVWDEYLAKNLDPKKYWLPQVFEKGTYHRLFWFTKDFIHGKPSALQDGNVKLLEPNIEKIAQLALDILNLPKNRCHS